MAEEEPHLQFKWKWLGIEGSARGPLAICALCGLVLLFVVALEFGSPMRVARAVIHNGISAKLAISDLQRATIP